MRRINLPFAIINLELLDVHPGMFLQQWVFAFTVGIAVGIVWLDGVTTKLFSAVESWDHQRLDLVNLDEVEPIFIGELGQVA